MNKLENINSVYKNMNINLNKYIKKNFYLFFFKIIINFDKKLLFINNFNLNVIL